MSSFFVVFLLLGAPVAFAMGLAAALAIFIQGEVPLVLLPQTMFIQVDSFALLAVPLFILAGELMNAAGITERIVHFSRATMGHVRGGLAHANILTNTFMAAISGSAAADVAAVGSIMIPAMAREGYKKEFAVAVTACASMLAPIIPPSIIAVIYASMAGLSVGKLLLAGILPGLLGAAALMALTAVLAPGAGGKKLPRASWRDRGVALGSAYPALLMPIIVVGGIISGIFTPTEAAAFAVLYALVLGFAFKRLRPGPLYRMVVDCAVMTSATLIVLGGAALFSWVLVRSGVTQHVLGALLAISSDPRMVLLIIIIFLIAFGTVMEPVPALIIVLPIIVPVSKSLGIDQLQFGITVIMALIVGAVTPPVGILAMIACKIARIPYSSTFGYLMPFTLTWLLATLLVAYVPLFTTWLPSLMD
jgi:tripartite ATP-independent transporter DctM subunit